MYSFLTDIIERGNIDDVSCIGSDSIEYYEDEEYFEEERNYYEDYDCDYTYIDTDELPF